MLNVFCMLRSWIVARSQREEGATAIEYALMAALIALAIVVGATALGISLSNFFGRIGTKLDTFVP